MSLSEIFLLVMGAIVFAVARGAAVTSTALVEARPAALASVDLSRLLEAFLAGRNERTLAAYRADLEGFRAFLGAATVGEASAFSLGRMARRTPPLSRTRHT
jgi:hypothetical protein